MDLNVVFWNSYSTDFGSIVQIASPLLISRVIFVSTIQDGAELPGNHCVRFTANTSVPD